VPYVVHCNSGHQNIDKSFKSVYHGVRVTYCIQRINQHVVLKEKSI